MSVSDDAYVILDIETRGGQPWDHDEWLVAVGIGSRVYRPAEGRAMAGLLLAGTPTIVAHTNYDLRGLVLAGLRLGDGVAFHDTKVMAHMLDPTQPLDLASLAARYLDRVPPKPISQVAGRIMFECSLGLVPIEDVPWDEMVAYNESDLRTTADLYEALRFELRREHLWDYFLAEEAPFSRLLIECETTGVPFDADTCRTVLARAEDILAGQRAALVAAVGIPDFNPGSGDQLAAYLYGDLLEVKGRVAIPRLTGKPAAEREQIVAGLLPAGFVLDKVGRDYAHGRFVVDGLGLRPPRPDKHADPDARPTTSAKKLRVLHGRHPFVADYLVWKKLERVAGFMRQWLLQEHNARLHGRLDQAGTVTGRLASREPNMQQIPGGDPIDVRQLFAGALVIGDYSGLEVRLSAHFSGDAVMLDIFENGKDLYGTLAARAWGGPEAKNNERRSLMKVVMLASQYGARGEKLAETLSFAGFDYTAREANKLLGDLEGAMPRLFEWRQEIIAKAKRSGYVTTIAGRKRYYPDIVSNDWGLMARAERQAVNAVVQGSAADLVRRAMLAARAAVTPGEARMLLQVHDEVLWERGPDWREDTFERLVAACEHGHGFELNVPLIFEAKLASSWAEKSGEVAGDLLEMLA